MQLRAGGCKDPSSSAEDLVSHNQIKQMVPHIASQLNIDASQVAAAVTNALACVVDTADVGAGLRLQFSHDCRNSACHGPLCQLCQHNPHKKCQRSFAKKYLVNELLKSVCGAKLNVQLVNDDGEVVTADMLTGLCLQVSLIDSRAYHGGNVEVAAGDDLLEACILRENKSEKPLLNTSDERHLQSHVVTIPMTQPEISLSKLTVTDSSEALMAGRKPPMQLLVRVVNAQQQVIPAIPILLSEGFVVTTIRSSARKPEIPLVTDPVHKLEAIGKETVAKLKNIRAAARASTTAQDAVTLQDFMDQLNCVQIVSEFNKLVLWCEQSPERARAVQRVLKFVRGWEAAAAHARKAVPEDFWPRMFTVESGMTLLFPCKHGKVDTTRVLVCAQLVPGKGEEEARLVACTDPPQPDEDTLKALQKQAQQQWQDSKHPGWALVPSSFNIADLLPLKASNQPAVPPSPCASVRSSWAFSSGGDPAKGQTNGHMVGHALSADCLQDLPGSSSDDSNGRKRTRDQMDDAPAFLARGNGHSKGRASFDDMPEAAQSWVGNNPAGLLHDFAQDSPFNTVPFTQSTGFKLSSHGSSPVAVHISRAATFPSPVAVAVSSEAKKMMRGLQNCSPDGRIGDDTGLFEPALAVSGASLPSRSTSKTHFIPPASRLGDQHSARVQSPRSHQTTAPLPSRLERVVRNGCAAQHLFSEPEFSCDSTAIDRIPAAASSASPISAWDNLLTPTGRSWPAEIADLGQDFSDAIPRLWSTPFKKKAHSALGGHTWFEQPLGSEGTRLDPGQIFGDHP